MLTITKLDDANNKNADADDPTTIIVINTASRTSDNNRP